MPYRIVVASSKVEELCRLLRTLTHEDGIPRDRIALKHCSTHDPVKAAAGRPRFASEPADNHDAQFLLVTHQNVRSGFQREWMQNCDLVLFDESLVVGEAQCLPLCNGSTRSLLAELGTLSTLAERDPSLAVAAATMRALFDHLLASSQHAPQERVRVVSPDAVSDDDIRRCRSRLASIGGRLPLIEQTLDWAEQATQLRVFTDGDGRFSLLSYSITVPEDLQQVIVLDASDPIREIIHHDQRMQRVEDVLPSLARFRAVPGGLSSIKYHSHVQVHFASDPGGRTTMTKALKDDDRPWALGNL